MSDCYSFDPEIEECYSFTSSFDTYTEECFSFYSHFPGDDDYHKDDDYTDDYDEYEDDEEAPTPPGEIEVPGEPTQSITCITRIGDRLYLVIDGNLGVYQFETTIEDDSIDTIFFPDHETDVSEITCTRLEVYDINNSSMVALFDHPAYKMYYYDSTFLNDRAVVNTTQSGSANAFMSDDTYVNGGSDSTYYEYYSHSLYTRNYYLDLRFVSPICDPEPGCGNEHITCYDWHFSEKKTRLTILKERRIMDSTVAICNLKNPYFDKVEDRETGCWNEGEYAENEETMGEYGKSISYIRDYIGISNEDTNNIIIDGTTPYQFDVTSRWIIGYETGDYGMSASATTGITGGGFTKTGDLGGFMNGVKFAREGGLMISEWNTGYFSAYNGTSHEIMKLPDNCRDFVLFNDSLYYVTGDNKIHWTPIIFGTP